MVVIDEEVHLAHYGVLRRSGRYPWGSGGTQNIRNRMFLDYISDMREQGLSDVEIAKGVNMSTTQLRAVKSIAKSQKKQADIGMAQRLKDKGYSNVAIGKRMGLNESSVRALLDPGSKDRADVLEKTSSMLKNQVDSKKYIDVGSGVENYIGISKEKLNAAVAILQEQGYEKHTVKVRQIGTGFETELKVLAPPGTTQKEVWQNRGKIKQIAEFSDDGGRTFGKIHDAISIHPNRVSIKYKENGGADSDGVIYVRPGVEDVSLGKDRYAQVRVKVGDNHYIKGMAMYKDDLPNGTDILFNTSKSSTGNKLDAMKSITDDPDLPFGSVVRQILSDQGSPNERVTSSMNIVNGEGDWSTWSRNLSTQFLSKQSPALAKSQLNMTYERRTQEFDEINSLTNPTIRRKLLESFADGTDSAAVHLKAAALPRQNWHAILPIESISPSHIYAPNYRNGERVVLIRYPHGGTFEIPELIVNKKQPEARRLLGDSIDAVGIHPSVADRLSGADFDGDTVLVIPNNLGKVKISPALEGLKNFDPRSSYQAYDGMKPMSSRRKQQEMGQVSNLITDMTIRGASHNEIVRAVRHSMVVIDAEKHNLNWRQSAIDNGISQLKAVYQGGPKAGASTLISKASSQVFVPERKPRPQSEGGPIDKATGHRVFVDTGRTKLSTTGEVVPRRQRSKKLAETTDAFTLSSGTPMEKIYAEHSNKLKALSNKARLNAIRTPPLKYSPSANKTYSKQVASLNSKLTLALKNRPLERQAQVLANNVVNAKRNANPNLDGDSLKKIKFQALDEARIRTGAKKQKIKITQDEWDAIQLGAISNSKLNQILSNADLDVVRTLATPRKVYLMTNAKTQRAQSMLASGYTRVEVADALGVSLTTLDTAIKEA